MPDLPLSGRVALVTGAAIRVGRSIALKLAEAGADVAVHYRSSKEDAERVAGEIRSLGRRSEALPADLSDPAQCSELVRSSARLLGGIDLLVHSAANFHRASLAETDARLWDSAMDVNARAGFLLAREAAPMLKERRGRVVLISDLLAAAPPRDYLAHAVSKSAVEGVTRALAVELAPEVSVNAVAPGAVLLPAWMTAEEAERIARKIPLRRIGSPEDVAETVLFLCAGPAFITGQVLRADGGESVT